MRASELAERIPGAKWVRDHWEALCRAHPDKNPSVKWKDQGDRVLVKCYAGCKTEDVLAAYGLTMADLFHYPKSQAQGRQIIQRYPYTDAAGQVVYEKVRYAPKDFRLRRPDGAGGWIWNLDGVPRVLYHLDTLAEQHEIHLAEGEDDSDALRECGLAATTNDAGADGWTADHSAQLIRMGPRIIYVHEDNDLAGRERVATIAAQLHAAGIRVHVVHYTDLAAGGDVRDALRRDGPAGLRARIAQAPVWAPAGDDAGSVGAKDTKDKQGGPGRRPPWDAIRTVPEYLKTQESDEAFLDDDRRFFARGCVTEWYAPRGLGKTNVMYVMLVRAIVQKRLRVLLIDRDNPKREIKRRLIAAGAADLSLFEIVDRYKAPPLTDRQAWAAFPVNDFDIVVIDSLDAATEGVGEKDSGRPAQALAPLLDVARHENGPAVLILGNTVKNAQHSRGSGVMEDRADIVFEVRDITSFVPSGKRPWWEEMPPAGVDAWAERATRRKRRERYRLAFVASKYRVGPEPEPFVLEMRHDTLPWSAPDVTETMEAEGEASRDAARQTAEAAVKAAINAPKTEVARRDAAGNPMLKDKDAEPFLRDRGLSRKEARALIQNGHGTHWIIQKLIKQKGQPQVLVPLEEKGKEPGETVEEGGSKEGQTAEIAIHEDQHEQRLGEVAISAAGVDSGRRKLVPQNPAADASLHETLFPPSGLLFPPAGDEKPEARRPLHPLK